MSIRDLSKQMRPEWVERYPKSRMIAIKLFCLECTGCQSKEVQRCTSTDCPLYPWRPFKKKAVNAVIDTSNNTEEE